MSNKSQLLDPIGTAFKLILLNIEPENTRLTINDHVVQLELPDMTQSFVRWWRGESREDICYLTNTIIRFIDFYLEDEYKKNTELSVSESAKLSDELKKNIEIENSQSDKKMENSFSELFQKDEKEKKQNLKLMAKYICSGLEKLEKIYKLDNATLSLTYFRVLLTMAIDGKYNDNLLPHCIKDQKQNNIINIEKLKEIWSGTKISHICDLFTKLFDSMKNGDYEFTEFYSKGIKEMLDKNDSKFREIVNTIK